MDELWEIPDTIGIWVRERHIRSAMSVWADLLSRETDRDDWQLNPLVLAYLFGLWGPYSVDRFATMGNTKILRYNTKWRDPDCDAVDCLHLPDASWRKEVNSCNQPSYPSWPISSASSARAAPRRQ
eukprot:jgi/Tetstr1/435399/TSEL_024308.t1